jgi:multisubunit Na+/H+ antiporter MnhB subunit
MSVRSRPPREATIDLIGSSVQVLFHAVMLASVYLLVAGHNRPGGGFVGGLVAGGAISMRYVAGGIDAVRRTVRPSPWSVLGGGVLLASTVAAVPLLFGDPLLYSYESSVTLPVFGKVGLYSVMAFDVGVYVAVIGLVLMVFEAFGDDTVQPAPPGAGLT